jgi:type II secretory pathway component PulF
MSELAFRYQAIDAQGARTRGVIAAANPDEACRRLVAAGLRPLRLNARRTVRVGRSAAINPRDLAHLTYQVAVVMEARIPLADGLRSIAGQEADPRIRTVVDDVADQIESGSSVTEALRRHRDTFGSVYIETVRAAETSGTMVRVLQRLADMLERLYETRKNIRGAMLYPACVLGAMVLASAFLLAVIVPRFAVLYGARGIALPLPTQLLIGISDFVRTFWHVLIAGGAAAVLGTRGAWRHPGWRLRIDGWLHRVPVVRSILRGTAVGRFSHILGIALQSGVGLIEALGMAGAASGRPLLQADTGRMCEQVKEGRRLADVMQACEYMPGFARRMIAAGEEAGDLPRMCEIVARHYDRELGHLTKSLPTVLEPVLVALLAGGFLLLALAIFLPMWDMGAALG